MIGAPPVRPLRLALAFVRRDWAIALSYRLPFYLSVVQSVLTLGFLYFLGKLVGHRISVTAQGLHGGYFAYAVLGTTMLAMFTVILTTVASRLRTDQTTGTLEVLFTLPPRAEVTVMAGAAYQVVFSLVSGLLTVLLAVTFGMRFDASPAGAVVAALALAGALVLFGATGVLLSAFVLVFKRGETLTALGAAGLSLLGGVYFPVRLLPSGLRTVADLVPFTWALDAVRRALLGHEAPLALTGGIWLAAACLAPVSLRVFRAALRRARRQGTLGQY